MKSDIDDIPQWFLNATQLNPHDIRAWMGYELFSVGLIGSILRLPVFPSYLRSILAVTDREIVNAQKYIISKRVYRIPSGAVRSHNLTIRPVVSILELRVSDPGEYRQRQSGVYELGGNRFTVVGPNKARSVHLNNSLD